MLNNAPSTAKKAPVIVTINPHIHHPRILGKIVDTVRSALADTERHCEVAVNGKPHEIEVTFPLWQAEYGEHREVKKILEKTPYGRMKIYRVLTDGERWTINETL